MTMGATTATFIDTCFNYPSLSDMYKYATYDAMGNSSAATTLQTLTIGDDPYEPRPGPDQCSSKHWRLPLSRISRDAPRSRVVPHGPTGMANDAARANVSHSSSRRGRRRIVAAGSQCRRAAVTSSRVFPTTVHIARSRRRRWWNRFAFFLTQAVQAFR
jgi:hypothetical protein